MLVMIDNYDSFTFNLVQGFRMLGEDVLVFRNDEVTPAQVAAANPERIVISPGPGSPQSAGATLDVVRAFAGRLPILGVCLGHQAIGQALGGRVVAARRIMHGKVSEIRHDGRGLFASMPNPFTATRYHSLAIEKATLPASLRMTAWSCDDEEIMAVSHVDLPLFGVQFHPESILTAEGHHILSNFLRIASTR